MKSINRIRTSINMLTGEYIFLTKSGKSRKGHLVAGLPLMTYDHCGVAGISQEFYK
jgi:hypothetical protein